MRESLPSQTEGQGAPAPPQAEPWSLQRAFWTFSILVFASGLWLFMDWLVPGLASSPNLRLALQACLVVGTLTAMAWTWTGIWNRPSFQDDPRTLERILKLPARHALRDRLYRLPLTAEDRYAFLTAFDQTRWDDSQGAQAVFERALALIDETALPRHGLS